MPNETEQLSHRLKLIAYRHYPGMLLVAGLLLFLRLNMPFQYVAIASSVVAIAINIRRRHRRSALYARYQLIAGVVVLMFMVYFEAGRPIGL